MASELSLDRLQRWMQGVIVHHGEVAEALRTSELQRDVPAERLGDVLLPSRTLAPADRLAIYHDMYPIRMRDALSGDYPGLEHFLGDEGFLRLVNEYVKVHPSRSYSLNHLGDHLPEFVKTADVKRRDFCHELARLELAVTQAFDERETPRLTEAQVAAVAPEAWERAVLRPVASLRLHAFRYPVNTYLQTVKDDVHDHPKPRLKEEWVAVHRRDYGVYRTDLRRPAFDLLSDLVGGTPLGAAIGSAVGRGGKRVPSETELFRWFREWVSAGLFATVETTAG
jgi:hypothetical protein